MTEGSINDYQMEKRYIHKTGRIVWVNLNVSKLGSEHKSFALAHVSDITYRKRAERIIQESESKFRAFFDEAPISMTLLNERGEIIEVNKASCEMSGYTKLELMNLSFLDVTHPDYLESSKLMHQELMQGKPSFYRTERKLVTRSGAPKWIDLSVAVINDADGRPSFRIAHIQDIDLAKELELKLRSSETLYRQAERMGKLGHWVWDEESGRMTSCSEEYANIFGESVSETLEECTSIESSIKVVHPEDKARVFDALR
ncbi:MAG: PAS domain S-box-containing protein [Gammaproteobacteria bacterium]|jgi:PAS domain S-box-containing protein